VVMTCSLRAPFTNAETSSAPRTGSSPAMYSSIRPHSDTRARFAPGPRIWFLPFALNSFAMACAYSPTSSLSKVSAAAMLHGKDVAVPAMVLATPFGPSPMLMAGMPSRLTPLM